jgi:4-carboxymuconolactone decarboxylase
VLLQDAPPRPPVRRSARRRLGMTEVVVEVGELHRAGECSGTTRGAHDPADVFLVWLGGGAREQFERTFFDRRQAVGAQRFSAERRELEQVVQPRDRLRVRRDRVRDMLDVFDDRIAEPSELPRVADARDLLSDPWVHPCLPADTLPDSVREGAFAHKRVRTTPDGIPASIIRGDRTSPASPDWEDANAPIRGKPQRMSLAQPNGAEQLLRDLAAGDESVLKSVLDVSRRHVRDPPLGSGRALPDETFALVHLAAILAAGGSTTSLRWAVELAVQAGAEEDGIVDVLVTVAAIVGSARVVAAAPRLALAIGYDIEIEGWDGD